MRDRTPPARESASEAEARERAELARHIARLMSAPPKPWPSIFVIGDEAVFGITPVKRAA